MNLFDLLILDIDGVLTNGIKTYDREHRVLSKTFMCKDFTAIKRFTAAGVKVIMISGDEWNRSMAEKRNIDFYCSRDTKLSLYKSLHLSFFEKKFCLIGVDPTIKKFKKDYRKDIIKVANFFSKETLTPIINKKAKSMFR